MRTSSASTFIALLLLGALACERRADTAPVEDDHAASAHAAGDHGPGEALLPIMQRLGSEMMALTNALMTDDYATVRRSASAIAEHAPISAEELARIQRTLGSDMATFEAIDESVHVASVRLHEAADAGRPEEIVARLSEVQRGCVACHTQFREQLRTRGTTP